MRLKALFAALPAVLGTAVIAGWLIPAESAGLGGPGLIPMPSLPSASRPASPAWRWENNADKSLALVGTAGDVWRFRYEEGLDKPYFHPLRTVEGTTLTAERPADHIWHYGLWFSWKFINGVNYWEVDPKTGRPAGRTSWSGVKVETRDDF